VDAIVPAAPTVTVLLNAVLFVLTSNPEGGVTNIPVVMLAPDTLKLVEADVAPYVVLKADNVPVADITGPAMGLAIAKRMLLKNKIANKGESIFPTNILTAT